MVIQFRGETVIWWLLAHIILTVLACGTPLWWVSENDNRWEHGIGLLWQFKTHGNSTLLADRVFDIDRDICETDTDFMQCHAFYDNLRYVVAFLLGSMVCSIATVYNICIHKGMRGGVFITMISAAAVLNIIGMLLPFVLRLNPSAVFPLCEYTLHASFSMQLCACVFIIFGCMRCYYAC